MLETRFSLLTWNTFKLVCVFFYFSLSFCHLGDHLKEVTAFSLWIVWSEKKLFFIRFIIEFEENWFLLLQFLNFICH